MSGQATAIVDLNLLPASERPTEVSGRAAAIAAVFLLAISGLVPLAIHAQNIEARAATMQHRSEEAQKHLKSLELEFIQARARSIEIDEATKNAASLTAERHALQQGQRPLHEELSMVFGWGFLPSGARITHLVGEPNALRVEGVAAGPLDAIAYAETLAGAGGFPSARLASFAPAAGGGVFSIEVAR
ncbi:MAG: hypothetical protein WEB52_08340 [Dehalococcoidia bacterium]